MLELNIFFKKQGQETNHSGIFWVNQISPDFDCLGQLHCEHHESWLKEVDKVWNQWSSLIWPTAAFFAAWLQVMKSSGYNKGTPSLHGSSKQYYNRKSPWSFNNYFVSKPFPKLSHGTSGPPIISSIFSSSRGPALAMVAPIAGRNSKEPLKASNKASEPWLNKVMRQSNQIGSLCLTKNYPCSHKLWLHFSTDWFPLCPPLGVLEAASSITTFNPLSVRFPHVVRLLQLSNSLLMCGLVSLTPLEVYYERIAVIWCDLQCTIFSLQGNLPFAFFVLFNCTSIRPKQQRHGTSPIGSNMTQPYAVRGQISNAHKTANHDEFEYLGWAMMQGTSRGT